MKLLLFVISASTVCVSIKFIMYLIKAPKMPSNYRYEKPILYKLPEISHRELGVHIVSHTAKMSYNPREEMQFIAGVILALSLGKDLDTAIIESKFAMIALTIPEDEQEKEA